MLQGEAQYLVKGGDAAQDLGKTGLTEILEPFQSGLAGDIPGGSLFHDQFLDVLGEFKDFIDGYPTSKTGGFTLGATLGPINDNIFREGGGKNLGNGRGDLLWFFADRAQSSWQTLGQNKAKG